MGKKKGKKGGKKKKGGTPNTGVYKYFFPIDYSVNPTQLAAELDQVFYQDPKCTIVNNRVPHSMSENVIEAFKSSADSLALDLEQKRKLRAEESEWLVSHPPTLPDCCVTTLNANFEKLKILKELPPANEMYLLELLPVNLPLEIVVPYIEDEFYWKRRFEAEFKVVLYPKRQDWNWKCLYLERYLRKIIEFAQPQYEDTADMNETLELLQPYIRTLRATQLQFWSPPAGMDPEDIPEIYPNDHINLAPVCKTCQNIDEVDLVFGMNNVGENFEWRMFKMSVDDCTRLGTAMLLLPNIQTLRINKSALEDRHCQALMRGLLENKTLLELDLSECSIGNQGALCIAKLLQTHPTLQHLILRDNLISGDGGDGIGFALLQEGSSPVKYLDLKLNPLEHQGTVGIMKCMANSNKLEKVNLACCQFKEMTAFIFGNLLKINQSIKWLDISNNKFGELGGASLVLGMPENKSLTFLDFRETQIIDEHAKIIKHYVNKNKKKVVEPKNDNKGPVDKDKTTIVLKEPPNPQEETKASE